MSFALQRVQLGYNYSVVKQGIVQYDLSSPKLEYTSMSTEEVIVVFIIKRMFY